MRRMQRQRSQRQQRRQRRRQSQPASTLPTLPTRSTRAPPTLLHSVTLTTGGSAFGLIITTSIPSALASLQGGDRRQQFASDGLCQRRRSPAQHT